MTETKKWKIIDKQSDINFSTVQCFGATAPPMPQSMPPQYQAPGHNGMDLLSANENGKKSSGDDDENAKKGPSVSFNCVVS